MIWSIFEYYNDKLNEICGAKTISLKIWGAMALWPPGFATYACRPCNSPTEPLCSNCYPPPKIFSQFPSPIICHALSGCTIRYGVNPQNSSQYI